MNWIKVEDQLPELSSQVLTWSKAYGIEIQTYLEIAGQGKPVFYDDCCEIIDEEVCMWMPLPEPPKQ